MYGCACPHAATRNYLVHKIRVYDQETPLTYDFSIFSISRFTWWLRELFPSSPQPAFPILTTSQLSFRKPPPSTFYASSNLLHSQLIGGAIGPILTLISKVTSPFVLHPINILTTDRRDHRLVMQVLLYRSCSGRVGRDGCEMRQACDGRRDAAAAEVGSGGCKVGKRVRRSSLSASRAYLTDNLLHEMQ